MNGSRENGNKKETGNLLGRVGGFSRTVRIESDVGRERKGGRYRLYYMFNNRVRIYDAIFGLYCAGIIGANNAASFDINAACSGFIYALDIAESFLKSHEDVENILIICAEQPTRIVDWNDRRTAVLFGDAAGSVVVQRGDKLKSIKVSSKSNKEILAYKKCLEPTPFITKPEKTIPLVMLGQEVFKAAVSSSVADIKEVMNKSGITKDDVDLYVVHQANIRIIDAICHHLGEVDTKFPHNIENYGNTSSASTLLLLDELKNSGRLNEGNIVVLSAFGAGFTTGACVLEW